MLYRSWMTAQSKSMPMSALISGDAVVSAEATANAPLKFQPRLKVSESNCSATYTTHFFTVLGLRPCSANHLQYCLIWTMPWTLTKFFYGEADLCTNLWTRNIVSIESIHNLLLYPIIYLSWSTVIWTNKELPTVLSGSLKSIKCDSRSLKGMMTCDGDQIKPLGVRRENQARSKKNMTNNEEQRYHWTTYQ